MSGNRARIEAALPWMAGAATLAWACSWGAERDWPAHLRLWQLSSFGLAALVSLAALRGREPASGWKGAVLFWGVALLARAALIPHAPPLSVDIYRYVWDGRVWRAGINPFRYPPLDPHLIFLRDAVVYPRINYPEIPTIYPLVDQIFFLIGAWVAPGVTGLKLLLCGAELAGVAALRAELARRGLPGRWALLAAWHPLALGEIAANGHIDALGAALLLGALAWGAKPALSALGVAAAALSKWNALVLLPVWRWRARDAVLFAAVIATGAVAFCWHGVNPFLGLTQYLTRWRWNDSIFWLLMLAVRNLEVAKASAAALLGVWLMWVVRRTPDRALAARGALGALLLVSPVIHPWYALWILPLVALAPEPGWLWLLGTLPLAYGPWPDHLAAKQEEMTPWLRLLEFGPAFFIWIVAARAGLPRSEQPESGAARVEPGRHGPPGS